MEGTPEGHLGGPFDRIKRLRRKSLGLAPSSGGKHSLSQRPSEPPREGRSMEAGYGTQTCWMKKEPMTTKFQATDFC